jgi:hypothetical protein
MKALEVTAEIDSQHRLRGAVPADLCPGRVRVIILAGAAEQNPAPKRENATEPEAGAASPCGEPDRVLVEQCRATKYDLLSRSLQQLMRMLKCDVKTGSSYDYGYSIAAASMAFRPALRWPGDGCHETLLRSVSPAAVVR